MFNSPAKDDTVASIKNSAHEVNETLHIAANQAGRKVRGFYNAASDEVTHAGEKVSDEIRNNPIRSSVIALGVGVLLGALLRR